MSSRVDTPQRPWHQAEMTDPELQNLAKQWWYYTVELAPGLVARGQYPDTTPMLHRILLRSADLRGTDCLDLGTMEGLMPVLMKRQGARRVLALDAVAHCEAKMAAIKTAYGVDFEFAKTGLMYDLSRRLPKAGGFDLINLSGLLYHVFSPMHLIAGVRPLLKKNGLMIVSQNVICRDDYTMEFNTRGQLDAEQNTFWYHSVPALEETLRFFNLKPIDCLYFPRPELTGTPGGYLSVVCRAVGDDQAATGDPWLAGAHRTSWEYQALVDRERQDGQSESAIAYARPGVPSLSSSLLSAVQGGGHSLSEAQRSSDAHILRLSDND